MQLHLLLQTLQGSFLIKLRHVPKAGIGTYSLERTNTEYGDFVASLCWRWSHVETLECELCDSVTLI